MTKYIDKNKDTRDLVKLHQQLKFTIIAFFALFTSACTQGEPISKAPTGTPNVNIKDQSSYSGVFGDNGLFADDPYADSRSIGVNSFLWRASLDTISFMPVNSADPFGGVADNDPGATAFRQYTPSDESSREILNNLDPLWLIR